MFKIAKTSFKIPKSIIIIIFCSNNFFDIIIDAIKLIEYPNKPILIFAKTNIFEEKVTWAGWSEAIGARVKQLNLVMT